MEIKQTLGTIHTSFPRALPSYLPSLLTASLLHLQTLYPTFAHYYISSSDTIPGSSEDDSVDLTQLVIPLMDFVASVARGGKAKEWFNAEDGNRAKTLIGNVIQWVQMTDEDVSVRGCIQPTLLK
jgi:hypothetical protein